MEILTFKITVHNRYMIEKGRDERCRGSRTEG